MCVWSLSEGNTRAGATLLAALPRALVTPTVSWIKLPVQQSQLMGGRSTWVANAGQASSPSCLLQSPEFLDRAAADQLCCLSVSVHQVTKLLLFCHLTNDQKTMPRGRPCELVQHQMETPGHGRWMMGAIPRAPITSTCSLAIRCVQQSQVRSGRTT